MAGIAITRFSPEGKVISDWGEFDLLGLLQQLGVAPGPEREVQLVPEVRNEAPARAVAEREVGRERASPSPGVGDPLGHRRPVLEAVPGAAADDPDVLVLRVRPGEEVRVGEIS